MVLDLRLRPSGDETPTGPFEIKGRSGCLVLASVRPWIPLQSDFHRGRVFDAGRGIYRRTALKRCQRKGDRPRGGFRLPLGAVSSERLGWLGSGPWPEVA